MNKWKKISLWVFGIAALITVSAFSSGSREEIKFNGITIEIDHKQGSYFVNQDDIEEIIRREYPYLDSLYLREINIPVLEESIDNHPSIRKAEVYSDLNGSLSIKVTQKIPLARIQHSGIGYYIDEKGDSMQLSSAYSARVPLVSGQLDAGEQQRIFNFFMQIRQDEFYRYFFSGLEVEPNGEWILYPRPGNHRIYFGEPDDFINKLSKLKKFYSTVVHQDNIDELKTINLKYKGQVICRKH